MKKVIITTEAVNRIAEDMMIEQHEKKATKEIKKQNVKRLMNEGIDKELAKVMTNVFYNYNI